MEYLMTIFYSKATGAIRGISVAQSEQGFGYFGDFAEEAKIVYDKTVIKYNRKLESNWRDYVINLETKLPELKPTDESSDTFELA